MITNFSWKALMPENLTQDTYRLENLFDMTELQEIQDAFATALGVASVITDINGHPVTRPSNYCALCTQIIPSTPKGRELCDVSHGIYECPTVEGPNFKYCMSAGLMDGGASIFVGDVHVANWLIGQVIDSDDSDERMMEFCRMIGADEDSFKDALAKVTRMSRQRYNEICHMLYLFARQLSTLAIQNVLQSKVIDQVQEQEQKMRHLSHHDSLTDLYNRRYFDNILRNLNNTYDPPLSIILGDVNGLKMINDVFGHEEGNRYLVQIAKIFSSVMPKEFTVARVGGDEFAILMPNTSHAGAQKYMQILKSHCNRKTESQVHISVALGAATATSSGENLEAVMKQAEDRMYNNKLLENRSTRSSIISSLRQTLEEKTHETEAHCQRVKDYMIAMSRSLNLPEIQDSDIELLAILHDIGKVAIPNHILDKPDKLTSQEWDIMQTHSEIGFRIASRTPELITIAEPILYHHERWDGKGYPLGLEGTSIPLSSRILSVVDAYDAMTHDRSYHKGSSVEEALAEIRRCSGTQFDPMIAQLFLEIVENEIQTSA